MKKIGIFGSGSVGTTLADGFVALGHEVKIGTRDAAKLDDWKAAAGPLASVGSFDEVAKFGEILVLAVKGVAAEGILREIGEAILSGKVIIDATNPIDDKAAPEDGVLAFFTDLRKSLMEHLQEAFPSAHFVKAFNSVGAHLMVNPDFGDQKPSMFIAGNNPEAKAEVSDVLVKFGWEVEDMGKAAAARVIEPLCILWCIPGFLENRWSHAFKLLKQ
ncbi:MAG: NAD(P)-binding domain-containing protein [Marinoscillum sp.]|uniref:NADPH-dependent F420 reductase n=1 Tax=Marinoscillum sp. TaxID=2024838 RepID=UPI003303CA66